MTLFKTFVCLFLCLFVCLFIAARSIFQLRGEYHHYWWQGCTFRPMCIALMAFSCDGSFTYHTSCDIEPWFIRSHPKDQYPCPSGDSNPIDAIVRSLHRCANHRAMQAVHFYRRHFLFVCFIIIYIFVVKLCLIISFYAIFLLHYLFVQLFIAVCMFCWREWNWIGKTLTQKLV
jgi:hypothetical protein